MTNFSYQLYSSRKFPPLENTLKMLSELGYSGVEGYGALLTDIEDAKELRTLLDQHNLVMTSCHVGLDLIKSAPQKAIEILKTIGIKKAYIPHIQEDERPKTQDEWSKFTKELMETCKPLKDAGISIGWHNHDFEFVTFDNGKTPMELMLNEAKDLEMEFDVAWCVKAGRDPIEFINKYNARITAAHVKDIAPTGECPDEDGWADVGYGSIDWPSIYGALKAGGTELFIMEHDNPNDHNRFARRSLATAKSL